LREPERAVRARGDVAEAAIRRRDDVLRERAAGRDSTDLIRPALGKPEGAIRAGRNSHWGAIARRYDELAHRELRARWPGVRRKPEHEERRNCSAYAGPDQPSYGAMPHVNLPGASLGSVRRVSVASSCSIARTVR